MFKKPIKLGGQNQLSGKDKKTIKNKLVAQFDPETVDKLFANNDKIICNKISGSKMLIYVSDDCPLFVDGTGKEEYFLSVYTGAAYEPLSKRLYINEGVEGFIFNGANLMWPGVKDLSRLGNFKKDDIVSIVNSANEVIAIGAMGCSLDELKNNADGSGIAVYILHFRGDKLWDLGTKVYPEVIVKAKEPKIQAKVQQPPVVAQPKIEVKPAPEQLKAEKGKGKKEVKQAKEDSESEPEEQPVIEKAKGKKDKRVSFNQEVQVSQPKGKGKGKKEKKVESEQQQPEEQVKAKGKGKKEKKVESEQQPQEPIKAKGKGKKDKKVDSDEEKPEEPVKVKGKGKKEKKQESDQEKVEEAPKGKGKGKKQTKQQKALPKKKEQSQESDNDIDFGNLVHDKKPARVQPPKAQKKVIQFSDEEDDKKGKKKGGRKGGNKKKQSDDEEVQAPKSKQEQKGKKKAEDSDEEVQVQQKKGKNKKQQSDQQEPEVQKVEKKKGKKDKKKKDDSDDSNEEETKQEKAAKAEQDEQENEEGAKSAINGQLMDEYFKEAFLNVLKLSKVQGQLPIDSGRFFSDYMILARPEGVKLQIKDTTYKKLGKFYEEMAKKKFIEFKPAKEKKGQQGSTITKIFWQNEELKNYCPTIKKMGDKDVQEKVEQYSKQKLKLTKTLEIEYVYKLNEQLKKILLKKVINYMPDKSDDEEGKQEKKEIFFTEKELKQKIEKYINQIAIKDAKQGKESKQGKEGKEAKQGKDKQKKTDKIITINYKENEFIYGLLKRQIEEYEQNLEKEEMMAQHDSDEQEKKKGKKDKNKKSLFRIERGLLINKIMRLASPHYNMSDKSTGLNKFKQGTFKGIQLIADKVINKNVTKIIGLESFAPSNVEADELVKQIHGFAHQLQVKFASSSNVLNLPGKNAGKEIVIQGNFVDELEAIFMTEFAIKKEYITIQNKLGKKKKN